MKTITVKGMGRVSVKPDWIAIAIRIETKDKEYDKTMNAAAERIECLDQTLEEAGFDKKAVKTTNFNVRTEYEHVKDKNGNYQSVFAGYVCAHHLKIEFDFDTKRLAKVLSAVSHCLAVPEFSILFTVKDPAAINGDLLKSAAQNAKEKAEILCSASGVKLGELVSIGYDWGEIDVRSDTDYKIEGRCMMQAEACLSNIEIEPDDIRVNDTATFVWEIQ